MTIRLSTFTALTLVGFLALAGGAGCTLIRNMGSGSHMDAERSHPVTTDHRTRTVQLEVTTDAQGEVANISVKRSSGKPGLDGYVVDTIRQGWPKQPSTRTLTEVSYSHENGFSEPKLISSAPVP